MMDDLDIPDQVMDREKWPAQKDQRAEGRQRFILNSGEASRGRRTQSQYYLSVNKDCLSRSQYSTEIDSKQPTTR